MWRLLACAALLGLVYSDDGCVCEVHHSRSRRSSSWGLNYAGARIDAQEMRIAQLSKHITELENRIGDDHDKDYNHVVGELERRLESVEGSDCGEHQFSCGRKSGQCISDLLVCDHVNDCENGHDEDMASICVNQVNAGRSWTGRVNWSGCITRHHNQMSVLITGNRRNKHFPSHMWVDAVIVDKWTENHEERTQTWTTHGYYEYAHRAIHLDAPEGSEKGIGMICTDAGLGVAECTMIRESDGHKCGHGMLTRQVHH